MSQITSEEIKKLSRLARIEVKEEELSELSQQVGKIIALAERLNKVDTTNIDPLVAVGNDSLRLNRDEVLAGNIADDILKNAKDAMYGYFSTPKVIE